MSQNYRLKNIVSLGTIFREMEIGKKFVRFEAPIANG